MKKKDSSGKDMGLINKNTWFQQKYGISQQKSDLYNQQKYKDLTYKNIDFRNMGTQPTNDFTNQTGDLTNKHVDLSNKDDNFTRRNREFSNQNRIQPTKTVI